MKQVALIFLQFKQWIKYIIGCRFFLHKRIFHLQPFIYVDENGTIVKDEIGNIIQWLDNTYVIEEYCLQNAMKIAKEKVSKIYDGDLTAVWYF